jgi:hypothetical protein
MPRTTFVEALTELKRKSKLMGRPPSTREVAAVSEGYFADASSRLARQKQLELQERGLTQTRELTEQQLGLQKERLEAEKEAASEARARSQRQTIGMAGGAAIGFAVGGPPGAFVGAAIGGAVGGCIIVSACTSRHSYEVNITRQVRDQYLGPITLLGYYALGSVVVPWIKKSSFIKKIVKRFLVDRLIDYGECLLGYKQKPTLKTSKIVTETFLGLCYGIGKSLEMKMQKEMA